MQRITLGIGTVFQPVENVLREEFLPALFKVAISQISRRAVTGL